VAYGELLIPYKTKATPPRANKAPKIVTFDIVFVLG
jgi:hypothetical protein